MPGWNSSGGSPSWWTSTSHAVEGHGEVDALVGGLDRVAEHRALEPEPLVAEVRALRHGLVGVVEVQRGRGEALVHDDAEPEQHRDEHAVGPGAADGARVSGAGAGRQLHRRSSGGTCSARVRPRRTVRSA